MKDVITRQTVVDKLAAYLHHELSLSGLVAWAETALMDGEFDDNHFSVIRDVVARVGVADVRAFGLILRQAQDRPGKTANICSGDWAIPPAFRSKPRDNVSKSIPGNECPPHPTLSHQGRGFCKTWGMPYAPPTGSPAGRRPFDKLPSTTLRTGRTGLGSPTPPQGGSDEEGVMR